MQRGATRGRSALWGALLGFSLLAARTAAADPAAPTPMADDAVPSAAVVEVRVVDGEGHEVALGGHTVRLDETATVRAEIGDHAHAVTLALRAGADATSLTVGVAYARDGGTLVDAKGVAAKLGVPVSIAGKDGTSKVVLVIAPRTKLEIGDSDDPLGDV